MGSLFRPMFLATSLAAVTLATHAYGQESELQQAIQRHLAKQGSVTEAPRTVMADLDGNGSAEAVVSYCVNESVSGGKNNPAKVHCAVSVFIQKNGHWLGAGQAKLGQGKVRDVRGGVIYADSVTFGPKDPPCCPSRTVSRRFGLKNGKLTQLR
jgi:hypothetical protein